MKKQIKQMLTVVVILVVMALAMFSMTGCGNLQKIYVTADKARYEALEPRLREWIAEEKDFDEAMRIDYTDLLYAWHLAWTEAVAALKANGQWSEETHEEE